MKTLQILPATSGRARIASILSGMDWAKELPEIQTAIAITNKATNRFIESTHPCIGVISPGWLNYYLNCTAPSREYGLVEEFRRAYPPRHAKCIPDKAALHIRGRFHG